MLATFRRAALAALTLAVLALVAQPLAAQTTTPAGELFVQRASTGRLIPVPGKPGVFNLTLAIPGPVVSFTDRPARRVNSESPASFAARWQRRGFAADPPNAALVVDDAPSSGDIAVVELLNRRLLSASVIRYRVRALTAPGATSPLARFARGADRRVARNFARASLYVDPSTGSFVSLTLTIPALEAGQRAQLVFTDSSQVGSSATSLGGSGSVITALNAYILFAGAAIPSTSPTVGLSNAGGTISGTATLPDGVSLTARVNGPGGAGPLQTISNGSFKLPVPQ